jgi:hypothetical protein
MLTIKSQNMEIKRENNDVMSATPSMGAVHFRFSDGTELSIPVGDITPQLSAAVGMIQTANAPNITVDFTNKNNLIAFV